MLFIALDRVIKMIKLVKLVFIACFLFLNIFNIGWIDVCFARSSPRTYDHVRVKSCYDGDTCRFYINNVEKSVRFKGIDAPELAQTFGRESKRALNKLLVGKDVRLVCYSKSYNRDVCQVFINQGRNKALLDVQKYMVQNGYAWDAPKYSRGEYNFLMRQAQIQRKGLWRESSIVSPEVYRRERRKRHK